MITLRPYQLECLESIKKHYEQGHLRQVAVLCTGAGKSCIVAHLKRFMGFDKKILYLAHREELITQLYDHVVFNNPELKVDIEQSNLKADYDADIIVASVPTIGRANSNRIIKFYPEQFSAIVTDEVHHSVAKSYLNIFEHFGVAKFSGNNDSNILMLGITATPNRSDRVALENVFDKIVYNYPILDPINDGPSAIRDGWLSPIVGLQVRTNCELDSVSTRAGDFAQDELQEVVNVFNRNDLIVKSYIKHANNRPTIIFCVDVAHSQEVAKLFNEHGVKAEAVWGDDPFRKEKINAFKDRKFNVITNCFLLGEGVDIPHVSCVILARPTKSKLVFTQQIGRGTRLDPSINNYNEAIEQGIQFEKKDCLIIDVVDNTSKHRLVTLPSLFGLPLNLNMEGKNLKKIIDEYKEIKENYPNLREEKIKSLDDLEHYAETIDLFEVNYAPEVVENSKFAWAKTGENSYFLNLRKSKTTKQQQGICIKLQPTGEFEATGVIDKQTGEPSILKETFNNLKEAMLYAEHWAMAIMGSWIRNIFSRDAKYRKEPITPEQEKLIRKLFGKTITSNILNISKGEASNAIDKALGEKVRRDLLKRIEK